jgi:hypothetical protein
MPKHPTTLIAMRINVIAIERFFMGIGALILTLKARNQNWHAPHQTVTLFDRPVGYLAALTVAAYILRLSSLVQ